MLPPSPSPSPSLPPPLFDSSYPPPLFKGKRHLPWSEEGLVLFAKAQPSRDVHDLILQTKLKQPVSDSEQHFLESWRFWVFFFFPPHLKEPRNDITGGPVHGSHSWRVPLLSSPLTLVFCLDFILPPDSSGQSEGFTHTASHTGHAELRSDEAPCETKVTDES